MKSAPPSPAPAPAPPPPVEPDVEFPPCATPALNAMFENVTVGSCVSSPMKNNLCKPSPEIARCVKPRPTKSMSETIGGNSPVNAVSPSMISIVSLPLPAKSQPTTGKSELATSIALSSVQVPLTTITLAWAEPTVVSALTIAAASRARRGNRFGFMRSLRISSVALQQTRNGEPGHHGQYLLAKTVD